LLNYKQLKFLEEYFQNPEEKYNYFAKLLSISPATVKNYHENFKDQNILSPDFVFNDHLLGLKVITGVYAKLDVVKLGLKPVIIILKEFKVHNHYKKIISMLSDYPYTNTIQKIENHLSLLVEVSIPPTQFNLFKRLINQICFLGYCKTYEIYQWNEYQHQPLTLSHLNLRQIYDEKEKIVDDLVNQSTNVKEILINIFSNFFSKSDKSKSIEKSNTYRLNYEDLMLLREININGRLKLNQIAKDYEKDITSLSKRLKQIRNEFILSYEVNFNKELFNIQTILLVVESDPKFLEAIINVITQKKFPYCIEVKHNNLDLTYQVRPYLVKILSPYNYISKIIEVFMLYSENLTIYYISNQYVQRNFFDFSLYSHDENKWLDSDDLIFNHVYEGLKLRNDYPEYKLHINQDQIKVLEIILNKVLVQKIVSLFNNDFNQIKESIDLELLLEKLNEIVKNQYIIPILQILKGTIQDDKSLNHTLNSLIKLQLILFPLPK
jgi:DNA-binding Lrp family transcriptional regulator